MGRLEDGGFQRHAKSTFGERSILCDTCYYLVLSVISEIWATIFAAKNFKISSDRTGLMRSAVFFFFLHRCARRQKSSRVQGTRRPQRIRLFLRALEHDKIKFPNKHRRGGRAVERSGAHLCWFEASIGPEAVYGIDRRSTELCYQWFDVAHVHQLVAKLVDCVDFFFLGRLHERPRSTCQRHL